MSEPEERGTQVYRRRLAAEADELRARAAASADERAPVALDQQSVGRLSRMDALQVQAMAKASEGRRHARLRPIEAALRRIDDGAYGDCASCGEAIGDARLDFDAATATCIACARGRA